MSQDELKYVVKLEADEKSFAEIQKALEAVEKQARSASKGGKASSTKDDTEQEVSALKKLRAELKNYQNDLSDIQAEAKRTAGATTDNLNVQRTLSTAISEVRTQIQDATRGYIDQDTAVKGVATTYNELVEQNRAVSIAMRNIPLDDTTGRLKELQEQYAQNNAKLKEFDASLGNFQRNVGDYEGGLRSFANSLAVIQGPLGPLAGRINSLATVISRFSKAQTSANVPSTMFGKIWTGNLPLLTASTTGFRSKATAVALSNKAILGLNKGLAATRLALITLGIPALVIGVLALINVFRGTQEGAERLRVATARVTARFNVFRDLLIDLGEVLLKVFDDPKEAVVALWESIKQNIVNRFVALPKVLLFPFQQLVKIAEASALAIKGIWSEEAREQSRELFRQAAKDAVDYVDNIGQVLTGVENPVTRLVQGAIDLNSHINKVVSAADSLETRMNAVLRVERALSLERAEQNRNLQDARRIARDMEVDAQTRLEALRLIAQEEGRLLEKELANERERLDIIEAQNELSKDSETDIQAVVDQRIKLADLERSSLEKQMSTQRDINTLERQIREENLRRERTRFELFQRNKDLELDKVRDNLIEQGRLTEALQKDLLRMEEEREQEQKSLRELFLVEFLNQKFSQEEAERLASEKAQIEMDERIYSARRAFEDQARKERIDADKFDRDIALRRTEMLLEFERDRLIRQGRLVEAAGLEELDKVKLKEELRLQFLQEFLDSNMEANEAARRAEELAELESEQRIADGKKAIRDAVAEERISAAQRLQRALNAINTGIFNDSKEIAVATAIVNTYESVTKALSSAAPPLSFKLGALALAEGMANVKKIISTKPKGSKSTSSASPSAPKVSTSFGLVDAGTNRQQFAFDTASQAQSMTAQNMQPTIVLDGEFDPAFLAVKVTMGNNQISSQGTGF